jgi:hypothetical protein
MKITLEFESYEEAEYHLKGEDYITALCQFKRWLRDEWKHGDNTDEEFKLIDNIYKKFNEIVNDNNIEI